MITLAPTPSARRGLSRPAPRDRLALLVLAAALLGSAAPASGSPTDSTSRATGPAPAHTDPRPGPGSVAGWVRTALRGEPQAYANVVVEGTRLGSMTDADGRFAIRGIRPGRVTLVTMATGFPRTRDTVEVAAGQVTELTISLIDRFEILRDSLERLGRWPPTLDSTTAVCLRRNSVLTVRPFGSDDFRPVDRIHIEDQERGRGRRLATAWRDSLLAALVAADFGSPLRGRVHFCLCTPEVRVVSRGAGPLVWIDVCYACGTLSIQRQEASQHAFFGAAAARFDRLRPILMGGSSPAPPR